MPDPSKGRGQSSAKGEKNGPKNAGGGGTTGGRGGTDNTKGKTRGVKTPETIVSGVPSTDMQKKIASAYNDPSRMYDTPENAKKVSKAMKDSEFSPTPKPGYNPNFPLADPMYGPLQFAGTMPPGATSVISGVMAGAGLGLADTLGLSPGPQVGYTKASSRENTPQQGTEGEQAAKEEEKRKKKAQAQQTLLGTGANTSPLGVDKYGNPIQTI